MVNTLGRLIRFQVKYMHIRMMEYNLIPIPMVAHMTSIIPLQSPDSYVK